jgi:transcriptional regulator with XRE-family HTH domain
VAWSEIALYHLDALREALLSRPDLWPTIAKRARVGPRTVIGIARNQSDYRNPTLETLLNIADAFEELDSREPSHAVI